MVSNILNYGIIFPSIFLSFGDKLHGRELQSKISQMVSMTKRNVLNQTYSAINSISEQEYFPGPRSDDNRRAVRCNVYVKDGRYDRILRFYSNGYSLRQPDLQPGEQTTAFFNLINPEDEISVNQIYVGWRVNPQAYGDSKTHFSTYWTGDEAHPGCWDLACDGFIIDNSAKLKPGDVLDQYYAITIRLFKDAQGNWQLHSGTDENNLSPMGHFPATLFSTLQSKATLIQFGGHVDFKPNQKSPPMGSGKLPSEGLPAAAAFKGVKYIDLSGNYYPVEDSPDSRLDDNNCYGLGSFEHDHFLYGGPGGCTTGV